MRYAVSKKSFLTSDPSNIKRLWVTVVMSHKSNDFIVPLSLPLPSSEYPYLILKTISFPSSSSSVTVYYLFG
uniref:Ovule protein n=1 Tax=Caenorhabditis tropicalis TaxID=1561998 RepID=A0A1I7UFA5_9PELO